MSGGKFDYKQYHIQDIIDTLEEVIGNYGTDEYLSDLSEDTFEKFQRGLEYLHLAQIYTQRIDRLLSGDASEGSFHEVLQNDLDEYFNEGEQ